MSYSQLTGMRSTRYPLSGLGCGCGSGSPAPAVSGLGCGCHSGVSGLGQMTESFLATVTPNNRDVAWMGLGMVVGAAIWNYGHKSAYRRVSRNRRRRHRRH